jgi:ADP-ribose pyrophosphatase
MKPHGPWKIRESREVYRDPWLSLRRDEVVRPDGNDGTYSVVNLKPGVCVVALDQDDQLHLTEEFHYGVGAVTLEGVSGGREPDEPPIEAAQRELREELGITASMWTELGVVDPFTASVVSPTYLFLARNLSLGPTDWEGTEQIRHVVIRLEDAIEAAMNSRITHAPSVAAILKAARLLQR